jgi:4-amino-4-deoxy-L-arabinose transferase-like glycosyltransferase
MRRIHPFELAFVGVFIAIAIFILSGVRRIPFHPDETSLLYQSRDLEALLTHPLSLSWSEEKIGEIDQTYRAMNPPLPKYILGTGRALAGFGPHSVSNDWNWSESWQENIARGALPNDQLLLAARTTSAVLLALSLIPQYLTGKQVGGRAVGILASLLLGLNALSLLHGRRAMAEGTLLFGVTVAMLSILRAHKRPWLAGLGTALAVCSKLSAGALAPVGLLASLWPDRDESRRPKRLLLNALQYLTAFALLYLALNPILWSSPVKSLKAQWRTRMDFLAGQIETFESLAPDQILRSPGTRLGVMIVHLYMSDPQFAEANNYAEETRQEEISYTADPLHRLSRGLIGGSLMLSMTLLGIGIGVVELRRGNHRLDRALLILLLATISQAIALLWANPLPFQRYYIPLVPFATLWGSYGTILVAQRIKEAAKQTAA